MLNDMDLFKGFVNKTCGITKIKGYNCQLQPKSKAQKPEICLNCEGNKFYLTFNTNRKGRCTSRRNAMHANEKQTVKGHCVFNIKVAYFLI